MAANTTSKKAAQDAAETPPTIARRALMALDRALAGHRNAEGKLVGGNVLAIAWRGVPSARVPLPEIVEFLATGGVLMREVVDEDGKPGGEYALPPREYAAANKARGLERLGIGEDHVLATWLMSAQDVRLLLAGEDPIEGAEAVAQRAAEAEDRRREAEAKRKEKAAKRAAEAYSSRVKEYEEEGENEPEWLAGKVAAKHGVTVAEMLVAINPS